MFSSSSSWSSSSLIPHPSPGKTGFLAAQTAEAFGGAVAEILRPPFPRRAEEMGAAGRQHVIDNFTMRAFGRELDAIARDLIRGRGKED